MARLIDEFERQVAARAARNVPASARAAPPSGVRGAMERFGWTTRDIAQRLGVSERTARRYRQQDRIPAKRLGGWQGETQAAAEQQRREAQTAAERKTWERLGRRGVSEMNVTGTYKISKSRYKANPWSAVRIMPGNKITPAQMRGVREALEQGNRQAADVLLNEALAEAYEAPGLEFEAVDSVEFDI